MSLKELRYEAIMATQKLTCMYVVGNSGAKPLDIYFCFYLFVYHSVQRVHNHHSFDYPHPEENKE